MELLCTLSKIENLEKLIISGIDGIIFGSAFSLRFNYNIDELKFINNYCRRYNVKRYISIDAMIFEDDRFTLYEYFELLKELDVDGIYFTDLGIINIGRKMGFKDKLIYDPDTLLTNSLDASFFLRQGIDVTLARELSFDEVKRILFRLPGKVDMQIFGHIKMSYSKRKFLSNYFNHLDREEDIDGKKTLRIIEESRNYSLPIIEDKYGTRIYSDYILLMYKEFIQIKDLIKRAIIEDSFIQSNITFSVINDLKRLTIENADFLTNSLINRYPKETFSNAYLDNKTVKKKEENE